MINDLGHAVLCDAGVDATMRSIYDYNSVHPRYRYKAPELLILDTNTIPRPTFAADIYALALAIQEVRMSVTASFHVSSTNEKPHKIFTLQPPFSAINTEYCFLIQLSEGRLINVRPTGISPSIWKILERCWDLRPQNRPCARMLQENFAAIDSSAIRDS
jgi:serine/threonine protein kinase